MLSDGSSAPQQQGADHHADAVVGGVLVVAGGDGAPLLEPAHAVLNGLIASDKFCWTRYGQLRLAWWRRPLRLRPNGGCSPSD